MNKELLFFTYWLLPIACLAQPSADAFRPTSSTSLRDVRMGSELSRLVDSARTGGFETSQGHWVGFSKWYGSSFREFQLTWSTRWTQYPNWTLIWGFGTGERAVKYRISPSVQLGFEFEQPLGRNSGLKLSLLRRFGGGLKEMPCEADYGEIGERLQSVNCRLASSAIPPEQTLGMLWNEAPRDRSQIFLAYEFRF